MKIDYVECNCLKYEPGIKWILKDGSIILDDPQYRRIKKTNRKQRRFDRVKRKRTIREYL